MFPEGTRHRDPDALKAPAQGRRPAGDRGRGADRPVRDHRHRAPVPAAGSRSRQGPGLVRARDPSPPSWRRRREAAAGADREPGLAGGRARVPPPARQPRPDRGDRRRAVGGRRGRRRRLSQVAASRARSGVKLRSSKKNVPPPQADVTIPSSTVTARMIPPPGWTCLASSGGTVGERSRQPSRSSSNIGSSRRGTGPSSTGASAGGAAVALGQPGPVGEVVARRRTAWRRSSGARARPASASRSGGVRELERDVDLLGGHARAGPAIAARRDQVRDAPGPSGRALRRSPRGSPGACATIVRTAGVRVGDAELAQPPLVAATIRGANSGCSHARSSTSTRCSVLRISHVTSSPSRSSPPRAASACGRLRASCAWTASRWRTTSPPGACSHWPRARARAPHCTASSMRGDHALGRLRAPRVLDQLRELRRVDLLQPHEHARPAVVVRRDEEHVRIALQQRLRSATSITRTTSASGLVRSRHMNLPRTFSDGVP